MFVSKTGGWHEGGVLDISSHTKPTNQKTPLGDDSCHPRQVHMAWPMQRLCHFEGLCTLHSNAAVAQTKFMIDFLSKAAGHCATPFLLDFMCGHRTVPRPRVASSWLTLPFHLAYERCNFTQLIEKYRELWPPQYVHLFPRVSWKLVEHNLKRVMQVHTRKLLTNQPNVLNNGGRAGGSVVFC